MKDLIRPSGYKDGRWAVTVYCGLNMVCNSSKTCQETWDLLKKWTESRKENYVLSLSNTGKRVLSLSKT